MEYIIRFLTLQEGPLINLPQGSLGKKDSEATPAQEMYFHVV